MSLSQPYKREQQKIQQYKNQLDRWFDWIIRIFVLSLFVVHPLIVTPRTYYNIVDTKRVFFTVVLAITCLCLFVLAIISRQFMREYIQWPGWKMLLKKIRSYEYALLAYWIVILVSTLCSSNPYLSLVGTSHNNEGLLMQSAYLLTAVIVGRLYHPREKDFGSFCITATLVSIIGIFQYYGVDFLYPVDAGTAPVGRNIVYISTMSNRNIISTYLCLAFCICVVLFCQKQNKVRWAYLPMAWIVFYMLILGDSESGYVGITVALLALLPFILKSRENVSSFFLLCSGCSFIMWIIHHTFLRREWEFFFVALTPIFVPLAIGLVAIAAIIQFAHIPHLPKRIYYIGWYALLVLIIFTTILVIPKLAEKTENSTLMQASEILSGNIQDGFGSNRIYIWRRALQMVSQRPIIGYGPDQFNLQFQARFMEASAGVVYYNAHNEYLQFLVDAGILGLMCMLTFYALSIWKAPEKFEQPIVVAVVFAMAVYMVQAFFNFSTPLAHPIVWVLWGVLGVQSKNMQGNNNDNSSVKS